jgi:L-ascorbate metabolism protein UlaG (beta-lactamase superfamily)
VQITRIGHSCLLVEAAGARLLVDPGNVTPGWEELSGLDAVLVTHQHPDHLDRERLPRLLGGNPDARLIVNPGTAGQLDDVPHEAVEPGTTVEVSGARVQVLGGQHAVIHPDIPVIPNNAYLVDGTHLHPGDSLTVVPPEPLEVLFLPTAAPWQKLSEAVGYLRQVAPRTAVPIHQAILSVPGMYYGHFERLGPEKTTVKVLDPGTATPV